MNKKIILSGLLIGLINFIASMAVSKIFGVIFPSIAVEYQNTNLFRPWSDPLMLLFFVYPFLMGIIFAWFWNKTKNIFGENMKGGINFGITYWIIATIPGMFITYSSMPYSLLMIISWLAGGLVSALLAGIILVKLSKKQDDNQ
jgi:membrane protease YdiL (CAAX protease family)